MVQSTPRRWHWPKAISLASTTQKLRPNPTERGPTAWHTNDEYTNAEASEEATASSAVANASEHRVLPIPTYSLFRPARFYSRFCWALCVPQVQHLGQIWLTGSGHGSSMVACLSVSRQRVFGLPTRGRSRRNEKAPAAEGGPAHRGLGGPSQYRPQLGRELV
jgi:hypothetical protein